MKTSVLQWIKSYIPSFSGAKSADEFIPRGTFNLLNYPGEITRRGRIPLREALIHELIYACLSIKALALQDITPIIQKFLKNDWELDPLHPATKVLRNPNVDNTFGDLIAAMSISESVFGLIYLEKLYSKTGGVIGLALLDPRMVIERPKPGVTPYPMFWTAEGGFSIEDIDHYVIESARGPRRLEVDDVVTIRMHDVRSPLSGHSPLVASMRAVGMDSALDTYINAYLHSGGPSGIIKLKNRRLTQEQAESIQEKWQKRYGLKGDRTASVAVFDEDGDYTQIGSHIKELASDEMRQHHQAAICSAFQVPGQLVEAFYAVRWGNQRAGQETAQQKLWHNNLSPTLTRYRSQLDKSLLIDFDGEKAGISTRVFWDTSDVRALQDDTDKRVARYNSAYSSGAISKNEYRTQLGLKPIPGGDFIPNDEENAKQAAADRQPQINKPKVNSDNLDGGSGGKSFKRKRSQEEKEQAEETRKAQDAARDIIKELLLGFKVVLVARGLDALSDLGLDFQHLKLSLLPEELDKLRATVRQAFRQGQATISPDEKPVIDESAVTRITDGLVASFVTTVESRLVNAYALRYTRKLTPKEILKEIEEELGQESEAAYGALASAAGFQAVAEGRNDEGHKRGFDRIIYSAILDVNVCDPCKADDGKEATVLQDLPPVPNPKCEGRWRCRCLWVFVKET